MTKPELRPDLKVWEADEKEHITTIFGNDVEAWTADDLDRVIARYKEYVAHHRELGFLPKVCDPKTGEPKPKRVRRKARVDPCQIDIEDLLAKETST
jgi:hypothetical protein